ncbi:MAG: hypothetical protein ACLQF2_19695 [Rhodomicrobium sp.]
MTERFSEERDFAPQGGTAAEKDAAPSFANGRTVKPGPVSAAVTAEPQPIKRYGVLLVTRDASVRSALAANFTGRNRLELRPFSGSLAELEEKQAGIELPDVLAVDLSQGSPSDIGIVERLKKTSFSKVPVVAISSHSDQRMVRGLMQAKVDDWLPAGCSADEIHSSCEGAIRAYQAEAGDGQAKCTSFFPAHGGCGNTALAIEAAFLIGGQKKQLQTTCLVDLNFQDGAIADYLDLTPAFQPSELANVPHRLDRQLLDVMLTRHRSGLAVLAAPRVQGKFIEIGEGLVAAILGLLSEAFDHLIVDLPKNWFPWTDNVLWGSDRVFVVTGFTVPGLRHSRLLAEAIAAKVASKTAVSVIVNKFHEPLIGAGLSRKDAESILESRLGGFIPNLGGIVDDAINQGLSLSETRAGNKIEKRLRQILYGGPPSIMAKKL